MKRQSLFCTSVVACALSVAGLATAQMGQMGQMHQQGATTRPTGQMSQQMQQRHQELMERMRKIEDERKVMDKRLADKVAAMDAAQGPAKVDAMAAVIKELVQQRQTMDKSHVEMMNRIMEHMREGGQMEMGQHRDGMMGGDGMMGHEGMMGGGGGAKGQ